MDVLAFQGWDILTPHVQLQLHCYLFILCFKLRPIISVLYCLSLLHGISSKLPVKSTDYYVACLDSNPHPGKKARVALTRAKYESA